MFGQGIKLFSLFGFDVRVDWSWLILGFLIAWSLALGFFPFNYPGLLTSTYWLMGIAGTVGLFISIVLHEFAHSLVARANGLPMAGITLFIFGGVAQMNDEPRRPGVEFKMAIVGPLTSVILGGILFLASIFGMRNGWSMPVYGVVLYLSYLNFALAVFNLIPAFPLDGGRVLRSILWKWKDNVRWATKVSSQIGAGFGIVMVVVGVLNIFTGNFIGGLWLILIGLFLRSIAHSAYQQLLIRQALSGETVRKYMNPNPVTVTPDATVTDLLDNYAYRYYHKMYPIVENGSLVGCITLQEVRDVPPAERSTTRVRNVMNGCSRENAISPDADVMDAMTRMNNSDSSRMMVIEENNKLVGIISLKDIMKMLSVKMDLEGEEDRHIGRAA